jgi:hypothetical protein
MMRGHNLTRLLISVTFKHCTRQSRGAFALTHCSHSSSEVGLLCLAGEDWTVLSSPIAPVRIHFSRQDADVAA